MPVHIIINPFMKNLFDQDTFEELNTRINNLSEEAIPIWGKMEVAQMLNHCQAPLNILLDRNNYNLKSNWIAKTFFKKSMYSDKPWAKNLPTVPAFKVVEPKEFEKEKESLLNLVEDAHNQKYSKKIKPHPVFGEFTKEQWGKMQYKHLDHHLRQFGV